MSRLVTAVFAAVLGVLVAATAAASGLAWKHTSLDPALEEARRRSRPLLVVVHAEWCEPCTRLDQQVFTDAALQKTTRRLVTARIDGDSPAGERMRARFGVERYPTSLFLNPDGSEWGRIVGFRELAGYLETLRRFAEGRSASDEPAHSSRELHARYVEALRSAQAGSPDAVEELGRLQRLDESAEAGLRGPLAHALSELLVALGRADEAIRPLERLIAEEGGSALAGDAAFLLARAHAERGQPKKGVAVLRRSVARSAHPIEAVWRLARFVATTDGAPAAQALRALEQTLAKHPDADFLWDIMASVLIREGRLREAAAALDAAIAQRPGLPWYRERQAALRAQLEQGADAAP